MIKLSESICVIKRGLGAEPPTLNIHSLVGQVDFEIGASWPKSGWVGNGASWWWGKMTINRFEKHCLKWNHKIKALGFYFVILLGWGTPHHHQTWVQVLKTYPFFTLFLLKTVLNLYQFSGALLGCNSPVTIICIVSLVLWKLSTVIWSGCWWEA